MNDGIVLRAPSPVVMAALREMFEHIGEPNPYLGRPWMFDDIFEAIEAKFGSAAARRCRIEVTWH
jgi:hypothetical protein